MRRAGCAASASPTPAVAETAETAGGRCGDGAGDLPASTSASPTGSPDTDSPAGRLEGRATADDDDAAAAAEAVTADDDAATGST
jgi:hypothetical protein